jgi:hypothetical protein
MQRPRARFSEAPACRHVRRSSRFRSGSPPCGGVQHWSSSEDLGHLRASPAVSPFRACGSRAPLKEIRPAFARRATGGCPAPVPRAPDVRPLRCARRCAMSRAQGGTGFSGPEVHESGESAMRGGRGARDAEPVISPIAVRSPACRSSFSDDWLRHARPGGSPSAAAPLGPLRCPHLGGDPPCAGWKPTPPFIPTHSPPTSDKRDTPLGSGVAERDSSPVYREISPRVDEEPTFRRVRHDSSSFPRTLHRPQRQLSAPTDMSLTSSRIATFQGSQAWHRRESRRDPANPGTTLNPRRRPTTRGWSRIRNRQRRPHPAAPQGSRSARRPTCPHSPR